MTSFEALLLGVVQGLTEFLPVSSSGHLVIGQALMGLTEQGIVFEIALHVATLVSVLIFYRGRIAELALGVLRRDAAALRYAGKLILATIPAVIVALAIGDVLEGLFELPAVAGSGLLVTGVLLWTTRWTLSGATGEQPSWWAAWWIGCAQSFAILPGVSRSGSTVAASLALGVSPVAAAEFSFLMSVPAILGAAVRKLPELMNAPGDGMGVLALGAAAALVSGILAIWLFVRLLRGQAFYRFAYYTWVAGAAFLVWLAI